MKTKNLVETKRVRVVGAVSALEGRVQVDWTKGSWLVAMLAGSVWGVGWYASWGNALLFAAGSGLTLCAGHSVGLHRLMIHRSFATPLWVEPTVSMFDYYLASSFIDVGLRAARREAA
jgi:stearoyl-CoA desaturase (delta-9 desaturase)